MKWLKQYHFNVKTILKQCHLNVKMILKKYQNDIKTDIVSILEISTKRKGLNMTGSELRIVRILFTNNRLSAYTGLDIDGIAKQSKEQADNMNMRGGGNNKALAVPTIRKSLKSLIKQNYVNEGMKKETYKKTYYLTQNGVEFVQEIITASNNFKKMQERNKKEVDEIL